MSHERCDCHECTGIRFYGQFWHAHRRDDSPSPRIDWTRPLWVKESHERIDVVTILKMNADNKHPIVVEWTDGRFRTTIMVDRNGRSNTNRQLENTPEALVEMARNP